MNDPRPLVSIVTPSFNQGRFLEQTMLSVLNQQYPRIEYIVIDGGSTDESPGIIQRHKSRLAYWHSRKDRGFGDAIRQGFEKSTGEILAYLNSDDLLAPDAVRNAVAALQKNARAIMVYGNRVCIDEADRLLYLKPNLPVLSRSPYIAMTIAQESCFWRREAYLKAGGISANLKFAIDYDLFSRFAQLGQIIHDGSVWGFFRKHSTSKTMTQYRSLGKQEGLQVQQAVWGGPVNRRKWLMVLLLMRLYGLGASFLVRKPQLPPSVRISGNVLQRFYRSLHEDSTVKLLLQKIGWPAAGK